MTKIYTVSGKSKTRPTDLPDGFTVEETEGPFDRVIGAYSDDDCDAIRLTQSVCPDLLLEFVEQDGGLYFNKPQVAKLRNALAEWLGDTELTVDSPEPDRSASYKDVDGDVWTYDFEAFGWRYHGRGGSYISSSYAWTKLVDEFDGTFPWTLKV